MKRNQNAIRVLCNCNNREEAEEIGNAVLDGRIASCFDIFPRELTTYFWPPKTGKKESAKGALLVIESLVEHYEKIADLIKSLHSDELPFVGYIKIEGLSQKYLDWIKGETEVAK